MVLQDHWLVSLLRWPVSPPHKSILSERLNEPAWVLVARPCLAPPDSLHAPLMRRAFAHPRAQLSAGGRS